MGVHYVEPIKIPKLEVGQEIKLNAVKYDNAYERIDIKGKVFSVNTHHFTVDIGKYKESFKFSDVATGSVRIYGTGIS